MVQDWPELTDLNVILVGLAECPKVSVDELSIPVGVFVTQNQVSQMGRLQETLDQQLNKLKQLFNSVGNSPAKIKLEKIIKKIEEINGEIKGWLMERNQVPPAEESEIFSQTIDAVMVKSLIGVQEVFKVVSKLGVEDSTCNANIDLLLNGLFVAKLSQLESSFAKIVSSLSAEPSCVS